jgi:hypothetical protein
MDKVRMFEKRVESSTATDRRKICSGTFRQIRVKLFSRANALQLVAHLYHNGARASDPKQPAH